jgi:hypothetical protein
MVRAWVGVTASSLFLAGIIIGIASSHRLFAGAWFFAMSMFIGMGAATCPLFATKSDGN